MRECVSIANSVCVPVVPWYRPGLVGLRSYGAKVLGQHRRSPFITLYYNAQCNELG